jgi:HD-GYP domain-containing protein (c-di-GMP phosphodiesterase class II)
MAMVAVSGTSIPKLDNHLNFKGNIKCHEHHRCHATGQSRRVGHMKKKIDVTELRHDMYVVELDRPWLGTPFLFQGFPIKTDEEIASVRSLCKHVYIDTERGPDVRTLLLQLEPAGDPESQPRKSGRFTAYVTQRRTEPPVVEALRPGRVYGPETSFEEEIEHAREIRTETRNVIENIFDDIRMGHSIDAEGAKAIVRKTAESIIRSPDAQVWLTQLKNKDEYTSIHCMNVCILSLAFGRYLGLSEDALNILGLGALLHDVGKICVPLDILLKPDKLSSEEFEVMKRHPVNGLQIVSKTEGIPASAMDVVYSHHERAGGSGYPRGLKNTDISLFSKIVSIVDVYDAITSDRVYHNGMDTLAATRRLYETRHADFDPGLIEQFIQCLGVYPVGSLVELNTGEVGIVISFRRDRRLRPKVLQILDAQKKYYKPPFIVDLSRYDEKGNSAYYIKSALSSGSYGVNVADYILLVEQLIK